MEPLDTRFTDYPIEERKHEVKDTINDTVRHVLKLEEWVKTMESQGIERCRLHDMRISVNEASLKEKSKLSQVPLYHWVLLIVLICGVVTTYAVNNATLQTVVKQTEKIELKLSQIDGKIDKNSERLTRLEVTRP